MLRGRLVGEERAGSKTPPNIYITTKHHPHKMSGCLDKSLHSPTAPDVVYSDDPLASGNPEHSVTKPNTDQTLAPPAIFTRTPKILQKKSKRARPMYSNEDPDTETVTTIVVTELIECQ